MTKKIVSFITIFKKIEPTILLPSKKKSKKFVTSVLDPPYFTTYVIMLLISCNNMFFSR